MMSPEKITVRNALTSEFATVGQLMFDVYAQLDGFPKPDELPGYFRLLKNVGDLTTKPGVELWVAVSPDDIIKGAVVYFSDMQYYGSGGVASLEKNAAGFRLLAVHPDARGSGIGKQLTLSCIARAREQGLAQVIIHSTKAMQTAWNMYESIGFQRSAELDFMQGELHVYGFWLIIVP